MSQQNETKHYYLELSPAMLQTNRRANELRRHVAKKQSTRQTTTKDNTKRTTQQAVPKIYKNTRTQYACAQTQGRSSTKTIPPFLPSSLESPSGRHAASGAA